MAEGPRPLPPLPERETLRLHQANERTLLAWARTAIGLVGLGFVVARFGIFLREIRAAHPVENDGSSLSLWLGVALAAAGAITMLLSLARYRAVEQAIERHEVGAPGSVLVYALGGVVAALGLGVAALLLR